MSRLTRFAALAAVASVALTACGDDNQDAGSSSTSVVASLSTVTGDSTAVAPGGSTAGTVGVDGGLEMRAKIISLSPSATETLFAIGAGSLVIAVDDQSNYPAEATKLPHDLSGYQPNAEAIAALKPDVVIHDGTTELEAQLDKVGIKSFIGAAPKSLSDVYAQIEQLGALTGHVGDATELVSKMTAEIDVAVKGAPQNPGLTYFHELDNTLYSVTSASFIGQMYALFGLKNIADDTAGGNDYPQLSAEKVISADPDLIFLADGMMGESPATVSARPGWSAITAVRDQTIFTLDADTASRWGPRLPELVKAIAEALTKVPSKV